MKNVRVQVATHIQDLDPKDHPVGTKIVTTTGQLLELDEIEEGRKDSGNRYWIQPGTLQPYTSPQQRWLPAYFLPLSEVEAEAVPE